MTTNRERINNMTNEELAKLLGSCSFCIFINIDCCGNNDYDCKDGILKWLESESEE